jgi:hypothetical protein
MTSWVGLDYLHYRCINDWSWLRQVLLILDHVPFHKFILPAIDKEVSNYVSREFIFQRGICCLVKPKPLAIASACMLEQKHPNPSTMKAMVSVQRAYRVQSFDFEKERN